MGKRLFWFAVGIGLAALIIFKGKEYYERFTPKGVADQIARTQEGATTWLGEFFKNVAQATAEREEELREATGLDG
ncbi:DUF6167 family protein [Propionicimonas sp.]|uniref:DUF6167 family protein n=1 Tax=Propionicimonas sp. TaxID=1955623 RepID=UPI00182C87EA|nr:DUF6167 family protein [Propionicimonas sp.]MBU3977381.1 hypothetical protein [Actinomycetota bacterium]MBA3021305.1 hypothetical protein [Propionicimonas sp.]MBU3985891.1 hypothetical protein [Actinomycetota bacterium]MBU4008676.1 hypothetical protein [Actinomycetota bacterium]MBU4066174.1 hypothetical protein [Actinomycetota bacterium]